MTSAWLAALLTLGALVLPAGVSAQDAGAARSIDVFRGNLYTVRDGQQVTVFLVTASGIVLGDPLNQPAASWLRKELAARFPGRPVRFVVFSHHHAERVAGASEFDPTAELVGHREFNALLTRAREIEPDRYREVFNAESDYAGHRTITLGGESVELIHPGPAHTRDTTVLYFPSERVVFAVDNPAVRPAPFSFGSLDVADVVKWVHTIVRLDFDVLLTGTGETIDRSDIVAFGRYLDDLVAGVAAGFARGIPLRDLQASLTLDNYRGDPQYVGRTADIDYVYRRPASHAPTCMARLASVRTVRRPPLLRSSDERWRPDRRRRSDLVAGNGRERHPPGAGHGAEGSTRRVLAGQARSSRWNRPAVQSPPTDRVALNASPSSCSPQSRTSGPSVATSADIEESTRRSNCLSYRSSPGESG